ncbi:MAG TPA: nitrite reductase (NAD(P)H) [Gammaproteobacteria bacterium]|nr:nitrite reductase (NAD(P)H) [Gammaproteobacteria bacterium]
MRDAHRPNIIVIGNGMVGQKLLENLVEAEVHKQFNILTFSEEPRPAYDRVALSSFFSGNRAEDLSLVPEGFFQQNGIGLQLSEAVTEIDRAKKEVCTEAGNRYTYELLILATGSYPFVPPLPGRDRKHCYVYRTIEDLEAIAACGKQSQIGVVVGGGLLGLEAAKALKDMDLETHVVEFAPRLMAVQVDEIGGQLLRSKIEALGVQVHTQKNSKEIVDGNQHLHRINFVDGEHLETDMIVFSAGIRPQDALARQCDLALGERGGIVINDHCQTSDTSIYAIGECALWQNRIFGLVAPGYQMAKVAAEHIAGGSAAFTGADMSTKLKLLGVDVASVGDAHARTEGARCFNYLDEIKGVYKKVVVDAKRERLLGAVLVGDAEEYGTLLQMTLNDMPLPENVDSLILPHYDGSGMTGLGVDALPESAQICSCNNVSKGDICQAVGSGATTLAAIKEATKASTTCGGCTALVGQVLNAELLKLGVEVNTDICEHFPHTRQELYHIVRINNIQTFAELIEKHGKGRGCDICKPAVASILASCWNQYILKPEHSQLQDTNDRFLANMQKNGTYSVVPRVPGGEITPDKLIAIGEVAKKYDLYTKITGGQRIDLFGARLEQLPAIWEELIAAGFESGHAYGKAMRTVKSCVGSTWCRYGVQDSVSMAIQIENRYRGVRSPHKLKLAVSGCTRECAEAQSKDVGVIATEKGWNLYVCGNGGMKPRHADLLASDLDDQTLIQYIDRFLMFYIRTADRLQRTSVWLDNLEGGIDYVRQVVCEDSLSIATELENDMQSLIDSYVCEWRYTVENEEERKRFSHFVNSSEPDSGVQFVKERGQIRPASTDELQQIPTQAIN